MLTGLEEKLAQKLRPHSEKGYELALAHVRNLPREDRELLLKFDQRCTARGLSPARKRDYLDNLVRIRMRLGKPLREVERDDIERLLADLSREGYKETTVSGFKVALKVFYKWLFGNDEEYPDLVRWIKTTLRNKNKLPRDSILTNDDIERLARAARHPRDRAIVLVLAESGIRAGELLSLRVGDVRFDQYGAIVTVSGKTGDRAVRLIASAPALATWLDHHPHRDDPGSALWVNIGPKFHGTAITYRGLQSVVMALAKRAGVKRRVHLHGFRHTAATRLARLFTEAEMKQYMGWVRSSRMSDVYVHLASRDVDKSLLRIHGLLTGDEDHERKFTSITCPRCRQRNSPGTGYCSKCGLALSYEAARELDKRRVVAEALASRLKKSPRFRELQEVLDTLVEEALAK